MTLGCASFLEPNLTVAMDDRDVIFTGIAQSYFYEGDRKKRRNCTGVDDKR